MLLKILKMIKRFIQTLIIFCTAFFVCFFGNGQVGIGLPTASNVHPTAQLEVASTSKGFLPPRMTQTQRAGIANPSPGLMVYQTDGGIGYWYFNGTEWQKLMVPTDSNALPAGTSTGQILQWDGTKWTTTSVCQALSFLQTDINNCGSCGNVCSFPNSTSVCSSGQCAIASCNSGFGNCNQILADGCEINLNINLQNCGACGIVCNFSNANSACSSGQCTIASCNSGFANCNSIITDGCEISLFSNINHCGTCNRACPSAANSFPDCVQGTCQIICSSGFGNCNVNTNDGCEVNLLTNVLNCGACGNVCPSGKPCVAGSCSN